MFDFLKKILTIPEKHADTQEADPIKKVQVATCALFIELAKADSNFDNNEREKIIHILKEFFKLEEEYINELIELASESVNRSISLYEFTPVINSSFSASEKYELLKNLWRLVYVDKRLDKYEEHMVKRIGNMLNVEYSDIVAAKIQVKEETNK